MLSSAIKIASVSDYITPSQECVKPLLKLGLDDPTVQFSKPDLIKSKNNVAKVSLQDCLACSGCITTAETILIESHSKEEFLRNSSRAQNPAVGISPQARASLANKYQLRDAEMHALLEEMFRRKRIKLYDLSVYGQMAIQMSQEEFLNSAVQPLLCSECPGWICYAEKTLDEGVIKHLSRVKSPQQLFGNQNKLTHDYIATIMPCYDKKLEAVRQENVGEVNLVLSTKELEEILVESGILSEKEEVLRSQNVKLKSHLVKNRDHENPSSNNYLDYIIEAYLRKNNQEPLSVTHQQRKNSDFIEIFVKNSEDQTVAQFARIYGLKNIANLVTQLKSKTCKYLYVEIMACPMGCLNGGGQVKIEKQNSKQQSELILNLGRMMLDSKEGEQEIKDLVPQRTSFKHIPKQELNFNW